jgi:hypothetical protein
VPESLTRLFGTATFDEAGAEPSPNESARIAHPTDERIAKGLHPSRLDAGDRELLLDGIREHLRGTELEE